MQPEPQRRYRDRARLRAAGGWALAVAGAGAGIFLLLWPASVVRALVDAPSPTATVRTVSGDVKKVTSVPLGGGQVPIDVDGDEVPDVDVAVAVTQAEFLPQRPVAPTMTVARDPAALAAGQLPTRARSSPPLQIEVIFGTFDPETNETDTASFGFDTRPGGSIPARFRAALLSGLESTSAHPLEAALESPGYNGPLHLFSNVDTTSLFGAFGLGYDPLPERLGVRFDKDGDDLSFRYDQTSVFPDIDLDATVAIREQDSSRVDLSSLVQHVPATLEGTVTNTEDGGSFTYVATGGSSPPDISARLVDVPAGADPVYAEARVGGLPSRITTAWQMAGDKLARVDFCAGRLDPGPPVTCVEPSPIGSVDFEVRNFVGAEDAPDLPPPLQNPPTDHIQLVARARGEDDLRFAARGHVSALRAVSVEDQDDQSKVVHTQLGDGVHPFRAGIDVATADGRFLSDSTVTNLPADLTATFRPQDDARPFETPLQISYAASAEADAASHVEIAPRVDVGCGEAGSTCVDARVAHVPDTLEATFGSNDEQGALRINATPRDGGALPDILADMTLVPEVGEASDPVVLHADVRGFPQRLVASYHLVDSEPDVVDLHACDFDPASLTCQGDVFEIGQVAFRVRNFLGEAGFGADDLVPTDHIAVVSRGNDDPKRFEVSGQTSKIRSLSYRKAGQVGGVLVDMGSRAPFRAHVDIDSPADPTDLESQAEQQVVDSVIDALPPLLSVCFRSPSDDAPIVTADPSGLTTPCQTKQAFDGDTVTTTPFTVIYNAPGANPRVDTHARIVFGGADPVGAAERSNPSQVISVATLLDRLPSTIRADYQPSKDLGRDVPDRPLRIAYIAPSTIDHVTLDLQQSMRIAGSSLSQCEDPRPGAESLCAHVDLVKLPTKIIGTVQTVPSDTKPLTKFAFRTEAGAATRVGCSGLTPSCPSFVSGLHIAKVKNATDDPLVVDGALEGLPARISGKLEQGIKDPPPPAGEPDTRSPGLTKLAVEACEWNPSDVCTPSPPLGQFQGVRFALQNFLVPDPIPAFPTLAQNFQFLKRDAAFRVSGALTGFRSVAFTSPGDTAAVRVKTSPVDRTIGVRFDQEDPDGKKTAFSGRVEHLPPDLGFCFRSDKTVDVETGTSEGKFCDKMVAADGTTALRLDGVPAPGVAKPNVVAGFTLIEPGKLTAGDVTVVGLAQTIQAVFDGDNVGFNRNDDTIPVDLRPPAGNVIDSVRFNVRNFAERLRSDERPFDVQRHFPTEADHSADDPAALAITTPADPYVSIVRNDRHFQAKGVANGVEQAFMAKEPCPGETRKDADGKLLQNCKHLLAKVGVGFPSQIFAFFLHALEGEDKKFITADVGPLTNLIDAAINTEDGGSAAPTDVPPEDLPEKFQMNSNVPPLLTLKTCPSLPCSGPSNSLVRGYIELGTASSLKLMDDTPLRDPLFGDSLPANPPPGEDGAYDSALLLDRFYDAADRNAALDLNGALKDPTPPPAAGSADKSFAVRVGTDPGGDKAVRARMKLPFPGSLVVQTPVSFSQEGSAGVDDIKFKLEALGFSGAPVDLGRGVVVLDDLGTGKGRGAETVIIISNIPGRLEVTKQQHDQNANGQKFLDARGTMSSGIARMELRKWDSADDAGNFFLAKARGGEVVPNLRVNIHNIPAQFRARVFTQEEPPDGSSGGGGPCSEETKLLGLVELDSCVQKQYMDVGLDFTPNEPGNPGRPLARRIDAMVSTKDGKNVKVTGHSAVDPPADPAAPDDPDADFSARAAVRLDPLDISFRLGIPLLAGLFFELESALDIHMFSVAQNRFQLEAASVPHLKLTRNDPSGSDHAHCVGPSPSSCVEPGVYVRPVWDVDFLFGLGDIDLLFYIYVFFGVGFPFPSPLPDPTPLPGIECNLGILLSGTPELVGLFDLIGTGAQINGYALSGGNYSQSLVLNALTPPGFPIIDSAGGLWTRLISAAVNIYFCTKDAGALPPPQRPFDPLLLITPAPGAPTTSPPLVSRTIPPAVTDRLCGRHDFLDLTVQGTLEVASVPNDVPAADGVAACDAQFVGTLRLSVRRTMTVAPGGRVTGDFASLREPPLAITYNDAGEPVEVPFAATQGTPLGCGGGGAYGGGGGAAACPGPGGTVYDANTLNKISQSGHDLEPIYAGSPGANANGAGGPGGGRIWIETNRMVLGGTISSNGRSGGFGGFFGTCAAVAGGGGGSGGGVFINTERFDVDLTDPAGHRITALGGNGGFSFVSGGGGGSGGRIKILSVLSSGLGSLVTDVTGGVPTGPGCGGNSATSGASGTVLKKGSLTSNVESVSDSTKALGASITNWTKTTPLTMGFKSASTLEGSAVSHQVMLCSIFEASDDPARNNKIPEQQPLIVPEQGGASLDFYLHTLGGKGGCNFFDVKTFPAGVEQTSTFTFSPSKGDGFYGVFTVTGRSFFAGDPSCFAIFPRADWGNRTVSPFCEFEKVPTDPDITVGLDTKAPEPTLSAAAVLQGQGLTDDAFTNGNAVGLKFGWIDRVGNGIVSNEVTNVTTQRECVSNVRRFGPFEIPLNTDCYGPTETPVARKRFVQGLDRWDMTSGDGAKTIRLQVTDLAGNVGKKLIDLTVDTVAPTVTATGPPAPASGWFTSPPLATLTAQDTGDGLKKNGLTRVFDNAKDGSRDLAATNPDGEKGLVVATITMPEGDHTIFAVGTDRLELEHLSDPPYAAKVDTIRPVSAISIVPATPDGDNGFYRARPFAGVSALDNVGGSGISQIRFQVGPDPAHLGPVQTATCEGKSRCVGPFVQLPEGTAVMCARSVDVAGNVEAQSCSPSVNIDTIAPASPGVAPAIDGEHGWHVTRPTVSLSASDAGSGVAGLPLRDLDVPASGLWVSIDHHPFFRQPAPAFARTIEEGFHDVRWFAEDSAGNRESIHALRFQVDLSDPASDLAPFPPAPNPAGWFRSIVSARLGATDGKDNSGVGVERFGVDGPASNAYTSPFAVGDGTHAVSVQAEDLAGRAEQTRASTIRIDRTAPAASPSLVAGLPVLPGSPNALTYTTSDTQSPSVRTIVRVFDVTGAHVRDIDVGVAAAGPGVALWDGTDDRADPVVPGLYYYRVLVVDEAGNAGMSGESDLFVVL